jgi:hypothetical protein
MQQHQKTEILVVATLLLVAAIGFMAGAAWQYNHGASAAFLGSPTSNVSVSYDNNGAPGDHLPVDYKYVKIVPLDPLVSPSPTAK